MSRMEEQVERIITQLTQRCEQVGLYASNVAVSSKDSVDPELMAKLEAENGLKAALTNGDVGLTVFMNFRVGDVAFSERVQNPVKAELDQQFLSIVPSMTEMEIEKIREKLKGGDDEDPLAWLKGA